MANIVLVTHGTGGDVKPFIKLGRILKDLNHEVTIITHCIYQEEAEKNFLNFVALDNYEEYKERIDKLFTLSDAIKEFKKYNDFNKKYCGFSQLYKEYKIIRNYCKKKNTIIIFRHRFSLAGLLAAEKEQIPAISLFLAPNYIQHLKLHEEIIGEIMKKEINKVREKIKLKDIDNWTEWMCSTKLKIALWPEWYAKEEVESIKNTIAIGFPEKRYKVKKELPQNIKEFLNKVDKVALITAGTSNAINPEFYKVVTKACEELCLAAILVTDFDEFVPKKLGKNTIRLRVAPIKEILPYMDVVIHHGGIGTASEALVAGTAQLILAHLADRPDNGNRLKNIGVAKVLPEINWQNENIKNALEEIIYCKKLERDCKLMKDKIYEENIENNLENIINKVLQNKEIYKVNNLSKVKDVVIEKEKVSSTDRNMIEAKKRKMILEILKKKTRS